MMTFLMSLRSSLAQDGILEEAFEALAGPRDGTDEASQQQQQQQQQRQGKVGQPPAALFSTAHTDRNTNRKEREGGGGREGGAPTYRRTRHSAFPHPPLLRYQ